MSSPQPMMTLFTMELIAGLATEMFGNRIVVRGVKACGVYAIVERMRPPDGGEEFFAVIVYDYQWYGEVPAWSVEDGFATNDPKTLWYAVRASLRRTVNRHMQAHNGPQAPWLGKRKRRANDT